MDAAVISVELGLELTYVGSRKARMGKRDFLGLLFADFLTMILTFLFQNLVNLKTTRTTIA